MKLAIIGCAGIPAKYGGFETLAEQLCSDALFIDSFTEIFVFSEGDNFKRIAYNNKVTIIQVPISANGISSILYDAVAIVFSIFLRVDIALILGISGGLFLPILRIFRKKIVTNLDGIEWMREKWSVAASIFLRANEFVAARASHGIIFDNTGIYEYFKDNYPPKQSSACIAYGGDQCLGLEPLTVKLPFSKYALSICRIEPENNIELILESFFELTRENLVFIGNWESSTYGKELRHRFGNTKNIHLMDPIYDLQKLNYIRENCNLYVHGHSKGGSNPSLIEMIFYDVQIFAFDCIFNRYTLDNTENYFKSSQGLMNLVSKREFKIYSNCGKGDLRKRYRWSIICQQYKDFILSV